MAGVIVGALVASARRRVIAHFTTAGATGPAHAVAWQSGRPRLDQRLFRRMVAFGAIMEAQPGHYWLDERRLADFRKENMATVLGVLAIAGLAAAGAIALGG